MAAALHLLPCCSSSVACSFSRLCTHLCIPFGAEENDSNQVSLPLPLSSQFLVLSLTPSQLSLIIMEGQRRFKVFCIAIPVSANRDFFLAWGMGKALPLESVAVLREDETQEITAIKPTEDTGLPLK